MKTLYLLRHAKAEPAKGREKDSERSLSLHGQETCRLVGAYLKKKKYMPARVIASAAKRTHETCDLVLKAADINVETIIDNTLYMATSDDMVKKILLQEASLLSLMVIGHNPGMHHLALGLAKPVHSNMYSLLEIKYPTGALTVLTFAVDTWQNILPSTGVLADFMTPS